jgi:hypothetical protein
MRSGLHQAGALTSSRDDDHMVVKQIKRFEPLAQVGAGMRLDLLSRDPLEPLGSREIVWVTVSRRSLFSLLHKRQQPTPLRTVVSRNTFRDGRPADDVVLVLQVENDGWQQKDSRHEQVQPRLDALLEWLFDGKENAR